MLPLLSSTWFEIWWGLDGMIWPNFYSSEQSLVRPVPMCEIIEVTLRNTGGKNWPRNIKKPLIFFPFFLGYIFPPISECASLYSIKVFITINR